MLLRLSQSSQRRGEAPSQLSAERDDSWRGNYWGQGALEPHLFVRCHSSPFLCSVFGSFSLAFKGTTLLQPSLLLWILKHFPNRQPPKPQTSMYIKSERQNIPWFPPNPAAFPHLACTGFVEGQAGGADCSVPLAHRG